MSADNQILILTDSKNEIRVSESSSEEYPEDPEWVFRVFRNSEVFSDKDKARERARKMEEDLEEMGGIVEYGINSIQIDFPFPKPKIRIEAETQQLYAVLGFIKYEAPWIPVFFHKYDNPHILILSGKYGTDLDWFCKNMTEAINGLKIEKIGENAR